MATSPTIDPRVAAATIPALEAVAQITDQSSHFTGYKDVLLKHESERCCSFLCVCVHREVTYR